MKQRNVCMIEVALRTTSLSLTATQAHRCTQHVQAGRCLEEIRPNQGMKGRKGGGRKEGKKEGEEGTRAKEARGKGQSLLAGTQFEIVLDFTSALD